MKLSYVVVTDQNLEYIFWTVLYLHKGSNDTFLSEILMHSTLNFVFSTDLWNQSADFRNN